MNPDSKALKKALQNRKAELQNLISQMKSDQLNKSSVYRNLENELSTIRETLENNDSGSKK
jgi:hypothetical protein